MLLATSARPRLYRVLVIPTKRSAEGSLPHILIPSLRERVRERLRRVAVSPPLTHTPHRCAELPYRGAIVCCYKTPPLSKLPPDFAVLQLLLFTNSLPASPYLPLAKLLPFVV